jgi:hypothetical protein
MTVASRNGLQSKKKMLWPKSQEENGVSNSTSPEMASLKVAVIAFKVGVPSELFAFSFLFPFSVSFFFSRQSLGG